MFAVIHDMLNANLRFSYCPLQLPVHEYAFGNYYGVLMVNVHFSKPYSFCVIMEGRSKSTPYTFTKFLKTSRIIAFASNKRALPNRTFWSLWVLNCNPTPSFPVGLHRISIRLNW
jgi:hypothetical protein